MRPPQAASERLATQLDLLRDEGLVVLPLDEIDDLLSEPSDSTFASRRSPGRAGIDDVALTLCAARDMPAVVTVQVVLPASATTTVSLEQVVAAFHARALDLSTESWREAMMVHNMGRRWRPLGVAISIVTVIAAYGLWAIAAGRDNGWSQALFYVLGGIAITVAWVVSWMVVETNWFDWRNAAVQARAYDVLTRASLDITSETTLES